MSITKDDIFGQKFEKASDFSFNQSVAKVFDDMVNRSIPFYNEIQNMIEQLVKYNLYPMSNVYDLGCSTGATLVKLTSNYKENDIKG